MFRKNYVPSLKVFYDPFEDRWSAKESTGDPLWRKVFVEYEDGTYGLQTVDEPTRFESLDDLMSAIYKYARDNHLAEMKKSVTSNSVKLKT